MSLVKCIKCGKTISNRAKQCIRCGCPMEKIIGHTLTVSKENKKSLYKRAPSLNRTNYFDCDYEYLKENQTHEWINEFRDGIERSKSTGWFYDEKNEGLEDDEEEMFGMHIITLDKE